MTTKRVVYTRSDGGVSVVIPAPDGKLVTESEQDWLNRVIAQSVPPGTPTQTVEVADLPNRRFRDCWRMNGSGVYVEPTLIRGQILKEVRLKRDALLAKSDGEKSKLDDVGSQQEKQNLARYRQALRDWPAVVSSQIENLNAGQLENYVPVEPSPT